MQNKQIMHPLDVKTNRIVDLLEHLVAVEMYKGGAGQRDVAKSLGIAVGKVNRLVKGINPQKENGKG